ncbi:hypothetical protein [Mesobacillus selenatarsenatis]|uniref:Uncharacterized protein n=1 Tax=Mesobacillus selenatarsenatis (strain DSM 18680 / JCM 14380 / FERM P-15431 / SF-1) TaxID=1321606 RepID=A0A0A8X5X4_MESS1|nr:hypothetical protein [Mesobacillus selenatarsenatis]GAM15365.1 hypothetical protein SAMD00020551_3522 [Mesobacillus selenatarsenatis SF-1]
MKEKNLALLRFSAVFSVIGAMLGAHMAGAGSYAFRPIHAHILVVGWLTLFAWAVYYEVFTITSEKLASWHTGTAIIGTTGLTAGMWVHNLKPFGIPEAFSLILYIGGGVTLLVSFILFLVSTFFIERR